ncbi:uncharacterized protein [Rutidosis leptorrhynchoides]|uniref:uncharacterized protein n=1 Tax=Rutidosis leptorrhynchoides TaxID=125765 RepID=UPI003A990B7E
MLRACVLEYGGSWDSHLPLVEFAYNNFYHSSISMPSYEMLYGRSVELHHVENVAIAHEKLKAARDKQKIYTDPRRRPVTFAEGERVYLKVSPWKGVNRFVKKGKLAQRYIGSFNIRQVLNDQTVVSDLPPELAGIHDTFNVCYLRKCKVDDENQIRLSGFKQEISGGMISAKKLRFYPGY